MEDFNEAMFKTKVDNIFVKLYTCIMKGDLTDVRHFISEELYNNYINKINELINRKILEDKEIIDVEIVSRYMDYIIDINTGDLISGDDTRRIERRNILRFEKKLNTKDFGIVRKCPGCGASINVNNTGKCEYCDTIFNLDDYDYILVSINVN